MATRNKKPGTAANGKKARLSPSVERQIALALVRVIECVNAVDKIARELKAGDSIPEYEQALIDEKQSIDEAQQILEANNYGDLESIASRVAAPENQLTAAISLRDGKAIARLGAELDRAKAGRPQIAQPKKAKVAKISNQPKLPAVNNGGAGEQPKAPRPTEQPSGKANNG